MCLLEETSSQQISNKMKRSEYADLKALLQCQNSNDIKSHKYDPSANSVSIQLNLSTHIKYSIKELTQYNCTPTLLFQERFRNFVSFDDYKIASLNGQFILFWFLNVRNKYQDFCFKKIMFSYFFFYWKI